jgi:hypothetical protein
MKNPKSSRHLGSLYGNLEHLVTRQEFASLPFTSEFFLFMAAGFFSLTFPAFCSSFLNLYPEALIKLVSELEAIEEAAAEVSLRNAFVELQLKEYLEHRLQPL